jgi:hypothetical protein
MVNAIIKYDYWIWGQEIKMVHAGIRIDDPAETTCYLTMISEKRSLPPT